MMKLGKKEVNLLLILLGLVIIIAVYYAVFNPYVEKTEALQAETASMKTRLNELEVYYQNIPIYEASMEDCRQEVAQVLEHYPSDVRTEDLIMYAVKMEDEVGVTVNNAGFSGKAMVSSFTGLDDEGAFTPMTTWQTGMTVNGATTYQQLKDLLDLIYGTEDKTKVNNVTVSYNAETASLVGSLSMTKYYIAGMRDGYTPTEVPDLAVGNPNPFGTIVAPAEDDIPGGEPVGDAAAN